MPVTLPKAEDVEERVSIFSSKFRTPRLPPLEELALLKVWALVFELMDFETELSTSYESKLFLFNLFDQKRAEKQGANLVHSLRKQLALDSTTAGSHRAGKPPREARSKSGRDVKIETGKKDEFRTSFWESNKDDHPDECMSRFLIQQDWDVGRAFGRLVAAVRWRVREKDVEDIIRTGEEGAHITIMESKNERQRRIALGFLAQCKMGRIFARGIDWEGRPVVKISGTRLILRDR